MFDGVDSSGDAMQEGLKNLVGRVVPTNGRLWNAVRYMVRVPVRNCARAIWGLWRFASRNSIFCREEEMGMCSLKAPRTLAKVLVLFAPRSVLDLGCGTGQSLDFFLDHGVDAFGVEGSALAISKARHPNHIRRFNLDRELDLGRRFDLVWCLEVVEHIHPGRLPCLMRTFARHADRIVLSAARPGQGGVGHFNEQPPSYWIRQFEEHGFVHDVEGTAVLQGIGEEFSANMLTFCRRAEASINDPDTPA